MFALVNAPHSDNNLSTHVCTNVSLFGRYLFVHGGPIAVSLLWVDGSLLGVHLNGSA